MMIGTFTNVITRGRKVPESRFRLSVTKPKLGLSLGTKVKILLHHTVVICSRCVRVELENIDQERLDIDVFWLFSFY